MLALIGNFLQPLSRLSIDVREIGEGTQRPEVLANITDGAFDLAFFPGRPNVTGSRYETAFARKSEEARIEANQIAVVLGDSRGQIVEPDFAAHSAEVLKSVDVAACESFEGLT